MHEYIRFNISNAWPNGVVKNGLLRNVPGCLFRARTSSGELVVDVPEASEKLMLRFCNKCQLLFTTSPAEVGLPAKS